MPMESSITHSVILAADADETTPLLSSGQRLDAFSAGTSRQSHRAQDGTASATPPSRPPSRSPAPPSQRQEQRSGTATPSPSPSSIFWPRAALLCGALSLVADLGDGLTAAPEVRLLEMAVCRDYYTAHDPHLVGPPPLRYVREDLCKRDAIQVELAYLRALKSLFAAVPGLLCTVLFGRLADVWGRKPVLLLGMTGQILSYLWVIMICYFHEVFPTRLVWASAIFQFMGGGHRNISALMNTVIVDVAPESMRTSTFYLVGALIRVTDMVSAVGGSWLLSRDLWLPFKISTPVLLTSLPIILAIPETLPSRNSRPRHDSVIDEASITSSDNNSITAKSKTTTTQTLRSLLHSLTSILRSLRLPATTPLLLCFATIFLKTFALMSNHLYLQFASKTLRWPIASAGYLLSIKAFMSLLVLLLLPLVGRGLRAGAVVVDTWVARVSLACLAAGSWMVGSASGVGPAGSVGGGSGGGGDAMPAVVLIVAGLVLGSAGNGITQTMRGLVAHFAVAAPADGGRGEDGDGSEAEGTGSRMGQLYAGIALLELVAVLTGEVAFAGLFGLGTRLSSSGKGESGWLGLPFYAAGITFFLGLVCTTRLSTSRSAIRLQ